MTSLMRLLLADANPPKAPDLLKPVAHGLEQSFIKLWPICVVLGLIVLAKFAWQAYETHRLSKSGIAEIDQMSGHRFEEYLATLFRRLGYRVELTRRHGDYGADLVVTKGKRRTAVQAKRWNKKVGVKAVQEAAASKGMYGCDSALVVANREFTQQAQKLARANTVELWGRRVLVEKLLAVRGKEAPRELVLEPAPAPAPAPAPRARSSAPPPEVMTDAEVAETQQSMTAVTMATARTATTSTEPTTCVTCGMAVSEKVRAYCVQHSERFSGHIYCFKHQRGVRAAATTD